MNVIVCFRWLILGMLILVLVVCSSVLKKLVVGIGGSKFVGMVVQGKGKGGCLVYCFDGLLYVVVVEDLFMCGDYCVGGLYKFGVNDSMFIYIFNVVCIFELEVVDLLCLLVGNKLLYVVLGKQYEVMDRIVGYVEKGIVLYYGVKFYGCLIFNCEVYDMYVFIVVYKMLLLLSFVWVINLDNGELVIVWVNDCGLFYDGWVIDFSYVVVVCLGIIQCGIGNVEVCVLSLGQDNLLVLVDKLLWCECCEVVMVVRVSEMDMLVGKLLVVVVVIVCMFFKVGVEVYWYCVVDSVKLGNVDNFDVWMCDNGVCVVIGKLVVIQVVLIDSVLVSVVVLFVVVFWVLMLVVVVLVCLVVGVSLLQQVLGSVLLQVVSFVSCDNVMCVLGQLFLVGIVGVSFSDIVSGGCMLWCLWVLVFDYVSVLEFVGCIVGLGFGVLQIVKD